MKVKNVIKGTCNHYNIEELNIIADEKVIYSGTPEGWHKTTDIYMALYIKAVDNMEVTKKLIFHDRKAFIFVDHAPEVNTDPDKPFIVD